MAQSKQFRKPWYVYADKLRPQFSTRIVEIQDANGDTVINWGGFDTSEISYKARVKLAQRIVDAINRKP
jgi:hypothetical protein